MTQPPVTPPLRVEQLLRRLPEVDLLAPLRALVMTTSRRQPGEPPTQTLGKRLAHPELLADLAPRALERFTAHLTSLVAFALAAVDAQGRGDYEAAVAALLSAGRAEVHAGREAAALLWFEQALGIAETAASRLPEIETLRTLGTHQFAAREYASAGRHFQRCFTLAEAEDEQDQATRASIALGALSAALGNPFGAGAWFERALAFGSANVELRGRAHLGRSEVHAVRGDLPAAAAELERAALALRGAPPTVTIADAPPAGGRPITMSPDAVAAAIALEHECPALLALARGEARLAARLGRGDEAVALFRIALSHALRGEHDAQLALKVRIELCECLIGLDRLSDAEDEARLAEEQAVVHGASRALARIYAILGEVRGRRGDEGGFVLFEQAILLARDTMPTPRLLVETYLGYARFRARFDDRAEAEAYVAQARALLRTLGDLPAITRLDEEWGVISG